jgi:hypothetical protein
MRVIAVAIAFAVLAASAADAAPRKRYKQSSYVAPRTVVVTRDESGRTRTRIIVQRRSYLDGGTEVMPGDIAGARGYINLPTQRPSGALGRNDVFNPAGPIPDPWFLPGKNNPWPWFAD